MIWVKKDCKPDSQQKVIIHKILKALIYWYKKAIQSKIGQKLCKASGRTNINDQLTQKTCSPSPVVVGQMQLM